MFSVIRSVLDSIQRVADAMAEAAEAQRDEAVSRALLADMYGKAMGEMVSRDPSIMARKPMKGHDA